MARTLHRVSLRSARAPRTVRLVATQSVSTYRLSPEDVLAMVAAGILDEDERLELVDGVLVEMNPLGPAHEDLKESLITYFVRDARCAVRVESMFLTDGGYVLPDLQVAPSFEHGKLHDWAPLVVEIAQSSHRRDREKAAVYAAAGVPEYWIVDAVARLVVVHREPSAAGYAEVREHRDGELVPLLEAAPPLGLSALFAP